jgi:hypothetical protein
MGPIATQSVQAFTKLLAVVGGFISRNGTLVAIVAGSVAALFSFGVAALAAGIALQGLATGLRVIQTVLPLIPSLFSPIGLALAAMGAAIAGGVVIARTLSPAFREETDAIMTALMRLDFGAAWEVMNVNLAIALVQMYQKFAQAFDFVKNTVLVTSQVIGQLLTEALDGLMGVFGADILTLQAGFQKLGLYFRAAFDWDFAVNGLNRALGEVDDAMERQRQRTPTAADRSREGRAQVDKNFNQRGAAVAARDAGFEDTIKELRKDAARARERALGRTEQKPAEVAAGPAKPVKPKLPAAPPGAFMPPPETKGDKDKGLAGQGNWSGVGLNIGPEINRLEDPAQRTADATERTADAVGAMAGLAPGENPAAQPNANAAVQKAAEELDKLKAGRAEMAAVNESMKQTFNELMAIAREAGIKDPAWLTPDQLKQQLSGQPQGGTASDALMKRESNFAKAEDLRSQFGVQNLPEFDEKISEAESRLASATAAAKQAPAADAGVINPRMAETVPAVAMDTVADRAPGVQMAAAAGTQAAVETSQIGITFTQVGSEIVAAVNAGTEVSKAMLAAINKIAEKKSTELAFQ